MKLTFILLLTAFLHVTANVYSQDRRISLKFNHLAIGEILKQIESTTPYKFVYSSDIFPASNEISGEFKETKTSLVLNEILKNTGFSYKLQNNNVIVISKIVVPKAALIFIKGKVTNKLGEAMPGVTVLVKGTKQATVTTSEGTYEIVTEANNILTFYFIGYKLKEVAVNGLKEINVQLDDDITKLDETVIIGYGTTTKRFNTGQITTVTAKQIEQQPVTNIMQALQSLVPGLSIVQSNGYASGQFSISLRGKKDFFGSSSAPSNPLIIVDGVPLPTSYGDINRVGLNQNNIFGPNSGQNPFFGINPQDIESVDVLKDADATAIYGSRGGNGVILITTKKGKPGQSGLSVNAYTGVTGKPKKIELLNTTQYLAMRREAFKNSGITPNASNAPDLFNYDTTRNVNWQKVLAATSVTSDVEIAYHGGNALTNFRLNGAYHRDGLPVPTGLPNNYSSERMSGSFGLNHSSIDKRFTSSLIINYSKTDETAPPGDFYQYSLPPNAPDILNAAGQLNFAGYGGSNNYPYNFQSLFQKYNANTNNFSANMVLNYSIVKGLTATTSLGYSVVNMSQFAGYPASTTTDNPAYGSSVAQYGENNVKNWIVEPRVDYKRTIGKGELQVTVGGTLTESVVEGETTTGIGYVNESLIENRGAAASLQASSNYSQYRFQGYFARANYNWNGKYILNVSGRRDASSRFKAGDQWGNFGSVGAAWIFSEEKMVKNNLSFLSFGKLRGSYGSTGSPTANDYQYLSVYTPGNAYNGTVVLSQNQAYNPGFKWQINNKAAVGIDLAFFNDRISFSADWYNERTDNSLVTYPFPAYIGLFPIIQNLPAVIQNRGWEFTLQGAIVNKKDVKWLMNVNLGLNRNKLVAFPGIENTSYNSTYTVGEPLNIKKVYHFTGVNPATGLYTVEDKDNSSTITTADQYPLNLNPKFAGAMTQNVTFKNFQLSMIFSYAKQIGSYDLVSNGYAGNNMNQPVSVLSRWKKPGDITTVRKFSVFADNDVFNYQSSDALLTDASYIRLQNLSLSYALQKSWLEKAHLKGLLVYVNCQNVFTISPFEGYDPTNPGLQSNRFPAPRIFSAGLQLTL